MTFDVSAWRIGLVTIFGILYSAMVAWSKPVSNYSRIQLFLMVEQSNDGRSHESLKLGNFPSEKMNNNKIRPKRSSDTEYDYYKDTDYYNYYGVEDPVRYSDSRHMLFLRTPVTLSNGLVKP